MKKKFYKARVVMNPDNGSCVVETKAGWWSRWEHNNSFLSSHYMSKETCLRLAKERCDELVAETIVYER
jgi:hypothetical protein